MRLAKIVFIDGESIVPDGDLAYTIDGDDGWVEGVGVQGSVIYPLTAIKAIYMVEDE
jgi:hypothetical protein